MILHTGAVSIDLQPFFNPADRISSTGKFELLRRGRSPVR